MLVQFLGGSCQLRVRVKHEIGDETLTVLLVNKAALGQGYQPTGYVLKVLVCFLVITEFFVDPSEVVADGGIQQDFSAELFAFVLSLANCQNDIEELGTSFQKLGAV